MQAVTFVTIMALASILGAQTQAPTCFQATLSQIQSEVLPAIYSECVNKVYSAWALESACLHSNVEPIRASFNATINSISRKELPTLVACHCKDDTLCLLMQGLPMKAKLDKGFSSAAKKLCPTRSDLGVIAASQDGGKACVQKKVLAAFPQHVNLGNARFEGVHEEPEAVPVVEEEVGSDTTSVADDSSSDTDSGHQQVLHKQHDLSLLSILGRL